MSEIEPNVLLIGPRGSGKSTIGAQLAAILGRELVELDAETLKRFDLGTVTAVWDAYGEEAWREAEAEAFERCLEDRSGRIVALGGGTPMIAAARELIRRHRAGGLARVVYLRCSAELLRRRLAASIGDRPPLLGGDSVLEVDRVLAEREPTYRSLADLELDVGELAPAEAARAISDRLASISRGG